MEAILNILDESQELHSSIHTFSLKRGVHLTRCSTSQFGPAHFVLSNHMWSVGNASPPGAPAALLGDAPYAPHNGNVPARPGAGLGHTVHFQA